MDAVAAPGGIALDPGYISLSALSPGTRGVIVSVGTRSEHLTPLDRRLLEFGFCMASTSRFLLKPGLAGIPSWSASATRRWLCGGAKPKTSG
jgi:hypothetical protein